MSDEVFVDGVNPLNASGVLRTAPKDDAALAEWFASDDPMSELDFVDPEAEALTAASGSGDAGFRLNSQLAFAEFAARDAAVAMAKQLAAIREMMREARENPGVFVGAANAARSDAVEFAGRAAVTELAACLRVSPSVIRGRLAEPAPGWLEC